jgi:hypothetical protein
MSKGPEKIIKAVFIIFGFIVGAMIGSQLSAQEIVEQGRTDPFKWVGVGLLGAMAGLLAGLYFEGD